MDQKNLTFEKCESLPLMYLKYKMSALMTHSNDANYHRFAKIMKFSTTMMQFEHGN